MEQNYTQPKWEAKVSTTLKKASADEIWPLLQDFFNLHKWFPTLSTCYGIHGSNGEPGCIRYCAGSSLPSTEGCTSTNVEKPVSWSKERLLAVDHIDRSLTYEIVECNIGLKSYVSTLRVRSEGNVDGDGCMIEWWFAVEPMEGWRLEDLVRKYEVGLHRMARKMEDAITSSTEKSVFL